MPNIIKLSPAIAKRAAELALSKKAFDVNIVDLRKIKNAFTDFFVICSCDSDTQVRAVAGAIQEGLKESGVGVYHREGESVGQWVLIDCVDVVIHVFHRVAREYYTLERLWGDAKITTVTDKVPKTKAAKPKVAKVTVVKTRVVKPKVAKEKAAKPAVRKPRATKSKAAK